MLKYGVLLDALAMHVTQDMNSAYLHVHMGKRKSLLSTSVRFRSLVAQKASY